MTLGGPQSANDTDKAMRRELENLDTILDQEIPYLGICLGMQTLVKAAGGNVITCPIKETGFYDPDGNPYAVELFQQGLNDPLLSGIPATAPVFSAAWSNL